MRIHTYHYPLALTLRPTTVCAHVKVDANVIFDDPTLSFLVFVVSLGQDGFVMRLLRLA